MGLFNGYLKEGPGIDKDAPKKKGVFLYIDIVFRKFFDLISSGFVCFVASLPFLLFAYVILSTMVMNGLGIGTAIEETAKSTAAEGASAEELAQMLNLSIRAIITVLLYNIMGSGPVSASYAYITRCFTRGEHVWKMSDGWDKFKENFKHTILLFIVDTVIIALSSNAVGFYSALASKSTGSAAAMLMAAKYFTMVIMFLYLIMHIYVYQIAVTYECKFKDLLKSSITIAIAKLPMSFLLIVITSAAIVFGLGSGINPMVGIVLYAVIGHIFLRYPLEFYAARVIEKNIREVRKQEKKREAKITYLDAQESEQESRL